MAQRRWAAGAVYGGFFLVCFVAFLVCGVKTLYAFYGFALDFEGHEPGSLPVKSAAVWFSLAVVVYVANISDAYLAYRREAMGRAEEETCASLRTESG
jgi:hypothetical protein